MREHSEKLIKESTDSPDIRGRDDFWTDFKSRASLRSQESSVRTGPSAASIWTSGLATATALLVVGFFLYSASVVSATQLRFIDVKSDHSAVMILTSAPEDGTVVWIEGMTAEESNGETE